MKIAIFGASGRVGQHVTKRLLEDGHHVVVFVHQSSPFNETSNLTIARGDIHNIDDVRKAVKDTQAVVSVLGSWGTKSKDVVSSGIGNILTAMSEHNVKRIVSLTGSDAIARSDTPTILGRVIHSFIKLSPARKILADGEKHIKLLENSKSCWTVLRSPVMNNKGGAHNFTLTNVKPRLWQTVNRQSVAAAIVDLVEGKDYYYQAPYIKRGKV